MNKILIVDDDDALRRQMKWALRDRYDVSEAEDRNQALEEFTKQAPPVVLLDLGLPPSPNDPTEGLAILSDFVTRDPRVKVIIISGQSEKENAIRAIGEGAYDFLNKPVDEEILNVVLNRAFHVAELERQYRELQQTEESRFEGLLGSSREMQDVFQSIRRLAATDAPVLIQGESGTGKELAARAIHNRSDRRDGPFVAINCGAIPEALLEGELFGHEKGAFTGAHSQRVGRVETASGGTLFLDEIGELGLPMQVKFLRFLQERMIERIGGRTSIDVDARVIAATNRDLVAAKQEGSFREDLYFRLAVITLSLPPLRDRAGDIALLAKSFLRQAAGKDRNDISGFTADALRALEGYAWPGNVRELENRITRAVIMTENRRVSGEDLELASEGDVAARPTLKEARSDIERDLVTRALQRYDGNVTKAAEELGVSRPTLYELMGRLKIEKS